MRTVYISLLIGVFLSSCSLQKRKYLKGFYLDKTSSVQHNPITQSNAKIKNTQNLPLIRKSDIPEFRSFQEVTVTNSKKTVCDTLLMSNGVKMIVKVSDVNKEKIHYYLCDSENQAEFYIETAKIKKISYANGLTDELNNPKDAPYDYYNNASDQSKPTFQTNAELEKARKDANKSIGLAISGLYFFPLLIWGFILAKRARKILKGKRGYEKDYKKANTVYIIGAIFLGLTLIPMILLIFFLILLMI